MLSNIKIILSIGALAIILAGAFFINSQSQKIKRIEEQNKIISFERDNLKETLKVRNEYIDRINADNASNNQFREKQYNDMQNLKDSQVDTSILGPAFFDGLR